MTNDTDRFAIIPLPPGPAPHNSIMTGPLDLIMQNLPDTHARQDAIDQLEFQRIKADQISIMQNANRAIQVSAFCDSVQHITKRLDQFEVRRTERARKDAELEEAREQRRKADRIKQALDALDENEAPLETHHPAGDLHTVEPSEPQHEEQREQSDQGSLPRELEEGAPPDPGTDPDLSGSREPTARNPVGISW
jgi:hypothetical protein